MNNHPENDYAVELERFLDGLMNDEERAQFLEQYGELDSTRQAIALEQKLNESLLKSFPSSEMPDEMKEAIVAQAGTPVVPTYSFLTSPLVPAMALALVALIVVAVGWFNGANPVEPVFQPVALAQLHSEMSDKGYRPYYNCEDDERFAQVFEKRQGIALRLAELPEGREMLGLSYEGGLSRDTTAMLSIVDGQQVTVFVDSLKKRHDPELLKGNADFKVFKRCLDPLIFYEVTPFDEPRMVDYFEKVPK